MFECLLGGPLTKKSEDQKLHSQNMLMKPFSEHVHPMRKTLAYLCLCRRTITVLFSYLQLPFPKFPMPQLYLKDTLSHWSLERQIWDLFSCPSSLGCLLNKHFLCCKPWCLSVWLAAHWTNKLSLVTFVLFCYLHDEYLCYFLIPTVTQQARKILLLS